MILIAPLLVFALLISVLIGYILWKALIGVALGVGDAFRYWNNRRKYGL